MVYRKFKGKRRYRRRRKYSKKFGKKRNTLGKKLRKLSRFVYKTIEKKHCTLIGGLLQDNFNGGITEIRDDRWGWHQLTIQPESIGPRDDDRIGSDITLSSIHFQFIISQMPSNVMARFLVLQMPSTDATSVTQPYNADVLAHVLQYPEVVGGVIDEALVITSPYKVGANKKVKVLRDFKIRGRTPFTNYDISNEPDMTVPPIVKSIRIRPKRNVISYGVPGRTFDSTRNAIYIFWRCTDFYSQWIYPTIFNINWLSRMTYRDA